VAAAHHVFAANNASVCVPVLVAPWLTHDIYLEERREMVVVGVVVDMQAAHLAARISRI